MARKQSDGSSSERETVRRLEVTLRGSGTVVSLAKACNSAYLTADAR
jgi:hypothetical protein